MPSPKFRRCQLEVEREWDAGGFMVRRVTYNVEADERATAYIGIPAGSPPPGGFPAVLCIQGTTSWGARQTLGIMPDPDEKLHGKAALTGNDYARALVRGGYVTISPEHFNCARRCPPEGQFDTAQFYKRHPDWTATGKSTFENQIALNVLETLPFVNKSKFGATGYSLGGTNSTTIAAYDERIKCAVPGGNAMTFNQWEEAHHWSRDYWYIYFPQLREKLLRGERIQCDQYEWFSLIAPRPCFEVFGTNDTSPGAQAHRVAMHLKLAELYRLLGAEARHAYLALGDGHSIPIVHTAALVAWFNRWLKYDGDPRGGWDSTPATPA